MEEKNKKITTSLYMREEIINRVKKYANTDRRSLSQFVEMALERVMDDIEKNGMPFWRFETKEENEITTKHTDEFWIKLNQFMESEEYKKMSPDDAMRAKVDLTGKLIDAQMAEKKKAIRDENEKDENEILNQRKN